MVPLCRFFQSIFFSWVNPPLIFTRRNFCPFSRPQASAHPLFLGFFLSYPRGPCISPVSPFSYHLLPLLFSNGDCSFAPLAILVNWPFCFTPNWAQIASLQDGTTGKAPFPRFVTGYPNWPFINSPCPHFWYGVF